MPDADAVLLSEIKAFLKETGIAPSTFGQRALGDPNFVTDMEDRESPRSPSGRTATRIRKFIETQRRKLNRSQPGEGAHA